MTFRDNSKDKIICIGNVGKELPPIIENPLFVDGLKHNLLSISQLCDKENRVIFDKFSCTIESINNNKILFIDQRVKNVYIFKFDDVASLDGNCLAVMNDNSWV